MMIKQTFLCAFVIYASCNFLVLSIARPIFEVVDVDPQDDAVGLNDDPISEDDPFTTPEINRRDPSPSSLARIPDFSNDFSATTPTIPPIELTTSNAPSWSKVPIVYRGQGQKTYNGHANNWWYEVDANGEVDTSPNFLDDESVPPEVKRQVQYMSDHLKHRGHF